MNKENLKEYAELKIQEKAIKARIDELNPLIKAEIIEAGFDKFPTSMGNFLIIKKKKWKYSNGVIDLEAEVKAKKAAEEADGTATFDEVEQLEFRQEKIKE